MLNANKHSEYYLLYLKSYKWFYIIMSVQNLLEETLRKLLKTACTLCLKKNE